MNFKFIHDALPLSYKILYNYVNGNRLNISEIFRYQFTDEQDNAHYLPSGYRWLYDFFDRQDLFLKIDITEDFSFIGLIYSPNENPKKIYEKYQVPFSKRSSLEEKAFLEMFKILESKLNEL